MKLEQMQYIVTIYETGSISRAARKFYTSRPNISNAVKNGTRDRRRVFYKKRTASCPEMHADS